MSRTMKLFEPIKIGNVELKNRLIQLPMTPELAENHHITERLIDFYAQRAKGGIALLTVGTVMVSDFYGTEPQYPSCADAVGIWSDEFIPEWKKFTSVIRESGAKSCCQLDLCYEWRRDGSHPLEAVGPSEGPGGPFVKQVRELTVEEIQIMVGHFGDGAGRAREAGFDMIQLHAGIGYMISRFISSYSNKRTDEYGGSLEKRMRFIQEIIADCQKKAGEDFPIMARISAEDFMPGGCTIEDTKKYVPILERAGIAALDIQVGFHEAPRPLVNEFVPDGAFVGLAHEVKKVVKIPVIAGYRINTVELAEQIVAQGKADMVGMARALVADPKFANKAREGRPETIRPCIVCSRCLDGTFICAGLRCTVNPELTWTGGEPAPGNKKVVIIGAGPAGMEAARIAAKRGHQVILFDKGSRLGGLLNMACILNEKLERLIRWYQQELAKLPIDIRLKTEVTPAVLEQMKPDEIIVAPGGEPIIPNVPGVNGKNVLGGFDMKKLIEGIPPKGGPLWRIAAVGAKQFAGNPSLMRKAMNCHWPVKRRLAVIGGGFAGCEVAMSMMKGREVTIIEESKRLGNDIGIINRATEMNILKTAGVRMETLTKVKEFTPAGVRVIKQDGSEDFIAADTVMLSLGVQENRKLYNQLAAKFNNVHLIGDAAGGNEIRRTREAIRDGYAIGMTI
ncbi:NAD(P)/FAD-dependent oxidoreductase [Desulfitobacterium hafniense]|nr:NAD(P)/FAD-dependent oxidoreductase [Desulfitobacterium hafniense]